MELSTEMTSLTAMKELVNYFETHGQRLDRQNPAEVASALVSPNASSFVSCIRFNGTPILPPVMTGGRLEEVQRDRHKAALRETSLKAKQRQHLMAKANSIVQDAETHMASEVKTGKVTSSRLPLERPSVLKPVVASAWGSVSPNCSTVSSVQSVDCTSANVSALKASTIGNTFATAEQGQEEFGLQTLDSVCSDFMSLEETLPTDFNGVPLTSVKQQKISHDLLRLSKILKVNDLNSTGGSDISDLPTSEYLVGTDPSSRPKNDNHQLSHSSCNDSQETVVGASNDTVTGNVTSSFIENSMDIYPADTSSPTDGNLSGAGSANTSGMSSGNSSCTADSSKNTRTSPRSLKNNTVHFASFVTEYIDTSASLSSENITVVKKKLPGDINVRNKPEAKLDFGKAVSAELSKENNENVEGLLCNVSLAEPNSPVSLIPSSSTPALPFQSYSKDLSSDKENDAKQANRQSDVKGCVSSSSESRSPPKAGSAAGVSQLSTASHANVSDSQSSSKSDATANTSESSNSTLIEEAPAAASSRDSARGLPMNIVVGQDEKDAEKNSPRNKINTLTRKPKKLPPEPVQNSDPYLQSKHPRSTDSVQLDKKEKEHCGDSQRKTHVRHGSYTLSEPSPALLRAQKREHGQAKGENRDSDNLINQENVKDHAKPLNIPVSSESEATGKAEHINRYLSQVQLHNSEDLTTPQVSGDFSQHDQTTPAHLQTGVNILHSLTNSHRSLVSVASDGEVVQEFQVLRQNLLDQQQKELEELFIQQRKQQMLLQAEIEEHQHRMKEQQEFLAASAPENLKVQSKMNEGELSPDANTEHKTGVKRFNFPSAKLTDLGLNTKSPIGSGRSAGSPLLSISTSSSASPKVQRPILRSPVKFHPTRRHTSRVIVPLEARTPEMQLKFEKLTALAKGFLCRRLLQSDKVQELVKTIKDTREFAFSFQAETPIKKGNFSTQDRTLLERIVAQLQAALLDVHTIFFDTPVSEQMALIEQTRYNSRERMLKSSSDEVLRTSAPRISTATLKAQERRRRAQEAESAVFGASIARPRTAPPATSTTSSHTSVDVSGPLKRHYQFLLSRAMKPAAMQASHKNSHVSSSQMDTSRSEMERPQTAPERPMSSRVKKAASLSSATAVSHAATDNGQAKSNSRPKPTQQQTVQPASSKNSKTTNKSSKSWR